MQFLLDNSKVVSLCPTIIYDGHGHIDGYESLDLCVIEDDTEGNGHNETSVSLSAIDMVAIGSALLEYAKRAK